MTEKLVYFPVDEGDVRDGAPAPRPLPRPIAQATTKDAVAGMVVLAMGLGLVFAALWWGEWKLGVGALLGLLGAWMTVRAVQRRACVRDGALVPARVYLMDGQEPTELRFFRPHVDALPEGANVAAVQDGISLGMIRVIFNTSENERSLFARLERNELPIPLRHEGRLTPAVCVAAGEKGPAALWTDSTPTASRVGVD